MRPVARAALLVLPGIVLCRPAFAHMVGDARGFSGGVLHPLLVPAQTLSLIALGLMIGSQNIAERRRLPAVFVFALVAGSAMVAAAWPAQEPGTVLILCAALAGLMTATGRPLPFVAGALLTGVAACALVFDSVPAVISKTETLLSLAGTAIAACAVVFAIAILAAFARRDWQRIAVWIAGSWCGASALLVLALRLAR